MHDMQSKNDWTDCENNRNSRFCYVIATLDTLLECLRMGIINEIEAQTHKHAEVVLHVFESTLGFSASVSMYFTSLH